ncbi:MAG: penicillin-binding protein 2 [Leptonema sp. (in: bacteria)]
MRVTLSEHKILERFKKRIYFFNILLFFVVFIFIFQLFNLQILRGSENKFLSKKFVSRQEYKVAPRGFFYDQSFNFKDPLVYNITYMSFVIYPSKFPSYEEGIQYISTFCKSLGISCDKYSDFFVKENWNKLVKKNDKIVLLGKVSKRQHERIAILQLDREYGFFESNYLRYYALGPAMAHISGYVGLPSYKELAEKKIKHYQIIGKGGIEEYYDKDIRGKDGLVVQNKILDATEFLKQSQQGNHLVLNINKNLQIVAYKALVESKKRGTVIVMKVDSGEILAMASYPSFDPNLLSYGSKEERAKHMELVNRYKGFLNLAIQSKFPPASTFKPITAIAALEYGNPIDVNESTSFFCPGYWKLKSSLKNVPDIIFGCHNRNGHGKLDLLHGIAQSCNVYFYNLSNKIGASPIINTAKKFRLDQETLIDLPGEIKGFVPDPLWKQIRWSNKWYDGDTVNLSIGQGFIETTPIEMLVAYAAIANNGKIVKPFIVKEIRDSSTNKVIKRFEPKIIQKLDISKNTLKFIQKALREVVLSGTGSFLKQPNLVPIAGKTGTVQTKSKEKGVDHAWFIGFAPYDEENLFLKDRVMVAVFVEHGLAGSASGIPIAYKIFKELFPNWNSN